jgi:hypothetical protein
VSVNKLYVHLRLGSSIVATFTLAAADFSLKALTSLKVAFNLQVATSHQATTTFNLTTATSNIKEAMSNYHISPTPPTCSSAVVTTATINLMVRQAIIINLMVATFNITVAIMVIMHSLPAATSNPAVATLRLTVPCSQIITAGMVVVGILLRMGPGQAHLTEADTVEMAGIKEETGALQPGQAKVGLTRLIGTFVDKFRVFAL